MRIFMEIKKNTYCAIIPAFNAEKNIKKLVNEIQNISDIQIFIINDGSTDKTSEIIKQIENVHIFEHGMNRGKGAAILTGIKNAIKNGFQFGIFIDADLQHQPDMIPKFILNCENHKVNMVLGKRDFSKTKMPFHRILSNTITSFIISLRTGERIHDSQCGYRLINLELVEPQIFKYSGFQFESEFLIRMFDKQTTFSEISIPTIYNDEESSINNFADTFRFIHLIFKSYLWK